MKRLQLTTAPLVILAGLAGCVEETQLLSERTVTPIGPNGGRALSAMGGMSLDFSAQALATTQSITIETRRDDSFPRVRSAIYELGPDGLTFDAPVTIAISVAGISVGPDEELALANVDGDYPEVLDSSQWSPGATDVRATLTHFSSYAVVTVYNPCAGKSCAATCTICDPLDVSCSEPPPATKACNRSGLCVEQAIATCSAPADAGVSADAGTTATDAGVANDSGVLDAGPPTDSGIVACTDTFNQNPQPIVDILLVIDDSCSMGDEQSNLASSFPLLQTTLSNNNVDFHIGVTTTDIARPGAGSLVGTPSILTSSTANLPTAFSSNVQVGTTGSAFEAGLEASRLALTTGANPGFLRGTGSVAVIYVTDEDDQSTASSTTGYAQFLEGLGGLRRVQVNTIVGDLPAGCQGPRGSAAAGTRYEAVRQALGGAFSSICATMWSQALTDLGGPGFGYTFEFELGNPATSIHSVTVDGVIASPADYSYDPTSNTITFVPGAVPGPSATIVVTSDC